MTIGINRSTEDWLNVQIRRRVSAEIEDWEERVLVANMAFILANRGFGDLNQVPEDEFKELLAENCFAPFEDDDDPDGEAA